MNKKATWIFAICLISTLAAIGTHIYLTQNHYDTKFGQLKDGGICNINESVNCTRTTLSIYSEVFGIPVSIFGGLVSLGFLLLLLAYRFPFLGTSVQQKLNGSLRLISLGIFAVSVVMAILSYGVLQTVCPGCSLAYALSLITLVTIWMMTDKAPLFSMFDLKLLLGGGLAILLVAWITHNNMLAKYGGAEILKLIELQLKDWERSPEKSITPINPVVMNPNPEAKMKIVEFADFLCGHCANAYPIIHGFMKQHSDVEFSYQAWPLDGECNPAIPQSNGTSCFLARMSHCAFEQGAPWKMQEYIFGNQRKLFTKDMAELNLKEEAPKMGLDYDKLVSCADSEETRETIRKQAQLGSELKINGTPSIFVNGKKINGHLTIPLFEQLYQRATQ